MRIGIDFDNTIACYDGVFHRVAVERGLVPKTLPTDKTSVRNHLRNIGREDDWTELQGYIYGARMDLVACYPGVIDFLHRAKALGHTLLVVSHKTRHPYIGPNYDLHAAAMAFLEMQGLFDVAGGALTREHCFLELTLADKLARIESEACTLFIDDLPEFLAMPEFPAGTQRLLFDPDDHYPRERRFPRYRNWRQIADELLSDPGGS